MSARIPPGYAEYAIKYTLTGDNEPMFSFLGLAITGVPNQADVDALDTVATGVLSDVTCDDYTLGGGWVTVGQDGTSDLRIDSTYVGDQGDANAEPPPQNVAVLVRKVTASGGRRNRGRMYLPGIDRTSINGSGTINSTALGTWNSKLATLITNVVALSWVDGLALLHDTAPFTPTPITGLVAQAKVATQRRRLRP